MSYIDYYEIVAEDKLDPKRKVGIPLSDIFKQSYESLALGGRYIGPGYSANRLLVNGEKLTKEDLKLPGITEVDDLARLHDIAYNLALGLNTKKGRDEFISKADRFFIDVLEEKLVGKVSDERRKQLAESMYERFKEAIKTTPNAVKNLFAESTAPAVIFQLISMRLLPRPDFKKLDLNADDVKLYIGELIKDPRTYGFIADYVKELVAEGLVEIASEVKKQIEKPEVEDINEEQVVESDDVIEVKPQVQVENNNLRQFLLLSKMLLID